MRKLNELIKSWTMVSFRSSSKVGSYPVRAELYSLGRVVGSTKWTKKRCELCINCLWNEGFTSRITSDRYKIYHKLNCDGNCWFIFCCINVVVKNILEEPLETLGMGGITLWIMTESVFGRKIVCNSIFSSILTA